MDNHILSALKAIDVSTLSRADWIAVGILRSRSREGREETAHAVSLSPPTETATGNTAPTIVTSRLGSKAVDAMSEQEFDREMRYQAAVQIADALLKKGSISEEEYHQIKTKLLEKYRPTLSTLLSGKPLI